MKTQILTEPSLPAHPLSHAVLFKRILLVESNPDAIRQIRDFLDIHFFDVTVAEGPVEAVKELIKTDYDVIVCDLTLPDFPAEMFFKAVGRVRSDLCQRFISITDSLVPRHGRSLGVLSIWKPIDVQILLEAVQTVLKKDAPAAPPPTPAAGRLSLVGQRLHQILRP